MKIFALLIFSALAFAREGRAATEEATSVQKPQVFLADSFFQVQARSLPPVTGGIDLPTWRLGAKTNFDTWIEIETSVGSSNLLYRPNWASQPSESVSLIDLKGTLHTILGDLAAGQFRVPWGLEGTTDEEQLWLNRSYLYEKGYFPLRDMGVGFHTDLDGFYMNLMVHDGKGAGVNNSDNRMFLTGQWGFMGPANMNFGLSATAGRITAPFVSTENRIRGGNVFFGFNIFGLGLQSEVSYFQNINSIANSDTTAWHADAEHPITDHFNLIARYEQLTPNLKISSPVLSRWWAGGEYHSKSNISRLFVYYVRNNASDIPNDEYRVSWRISPAFEE